MDVQDHKREIPDFIKTVQIEGEFKGRRELSLFYFHHSEEFFVVQLQGCSCCNAGWFWIFFYLQIGGISARFFV